MKFDHTKPAVIEEDSIIRNTVTLVHTAKSKQSEFIFLYVGSTDDSEFGVWVDKDGNTFDPKIRIINIPENKNEFDPEGRVKFIGSSGHSNPKFLGYINKNNDWAYKYIFSFMHNNGEESVGTFTKEGKVFDAIEGVPYAELTNY